MRQQTCWSDLGGLMRYLHISTRPPGMAPSSTASTVPGSQCSETRVLFPGSVSCLLSAPNPASSPFRVSAYWWLISSSTVAGEVLHRVESISTKFLPFSSLVTIRSESPSRQPAPSIWKMPRSSEALSYILPELQAFWKHKMPEWLLIPLPLPSKNLLSLGREAYDRKSLQ